MPEHKRAAGLKSSPSASISGAAKRPKGCPSLQHAAASALEDEARETAQNELTMLVERLRHTPAMLSKQTIQRSAALMPGAPSYGDEAYALPGDDCAALRCGEGYQLFAIEGMLPGFVEAASWFAGWSAVMANVSDIAAMGGRATAVVNAYWHHDAHAADQLLAGIRAACDAYGLILAGGHTSFAAGNPCALAVAIVGYATHLLSTLHVSSGQRLCMAVDLNGTWHGDAPYWKAFEGVPPAKLRAKLEVLPRLADAGLLIAAKDISNAGVLGTMAMLLEPTACGAELDLDALPAPADGDLERWLQAFPSYGFLLTVDDAHFSLVQAAFAFEGIACASIGRIDDTGCLRVRRAQASAEVWNVRRQPFTGFGYAASPGSEVENPANGKRDNACPP